VFLNINVRNTKGSRKKRTIGQLGKGKLSLGFFKYELYEQCSEACSEKLSYEIAKILKKPCARIEFAKDAKGELGIISFLFVDYYQMHVDAKDLFNKPDFDRKDFLTISSIENFLKTYGEMEFNKFIGLMVFDALVGETDRHEENWGLLKTGNQYQLSPMYDTSCNLLREFKNTEHAQKYYDGTKSFENYILKSKVFIFREDNKKQYTHFELIEDLYKKYPNETLKEIKKLKRITERKIERILNKLPEQMIEEEHKEYIKKYVIRRKEILFNIIRGGEVK